MHNRQNSVCVFYVLNSKSNRKRSYFTDFRVGDQKMYKFPKNGKTIHIPAETSNHRKEGFYEEQETKQEQLENHRRRIGSRRSGSRGNNVRGVSVGNKANDSHNFG